MNEIEFLSLYPIIAFQTHVMRTLTGSDMKEMNMNHSQDCTEPDLSTERQHQCILELLLSQNIIKIIIWDPIMMKQQQLGAALVKGVYTFHNPFCCLCHIIHEQQLVSFTGSRTSNTASSWLTHDEIWFWLLSCSVHTLTLPSSFNLAKLSNSRIGQALFLYISFLV